MDPPHTFIHLLHQQLGDDQERRCEAHRWISLPGPNPHKPVLSCLVFALTELSLKWYEPGMTGKKRWKSGSEKKCVFCLVISSFLSQVTKCSLFTSPTAPVPWLDRLSLKSSKIHWSKSLVFIFPETCFLAWYHRINTWPLSFLWTTFCVLKMSTRTARSSKRGAHWYRGP